MHEGIWKSRRLSLGVLILGLAHLSHGQTAPLAKERTVTVGDKTYLLTSKLKSILIGSFYYNYNHTTATPNLENTIRRIGAAEGWTVEVSTNGNDITATKLRQTAYQVFFANYISSWASATGFPQANRTAVQNFVEVQGGGLFIMHSTGDSRVGGTWPWYYNTSHPVNYTGESSRTNVSAHVGIPAAIKSHPVMEGISFSGALGPDSVVFPQGEWHWFNKQITTVYPNADIFLRMNPSTCTTNGTNTNCGVATSTFNYGSASPGYAASWAFPDMKGNIGYFMEGHDLITMNAMTQATWDRFFKQILYWTAGYDSTLVTTGVRKADLNFSLDASGVTFHPADMGVLITRPGNHRVEVYDMTGRLVRQIRDNRAPVDYDLGREVKGSNGIYIVRVTLADRVRSRRYLLR